VNFDYNSFLHRLSFLWSYEDSEEELQSRIPKKDADYTRKEEKLITDWTKWSAEYGLALGYDQEEIVNMLTPLTKVLNSVNTIDELIKDIQNSNKRTPLLTAPIFIPYLHLAAVRSLKTECGFNDHCQRIFYSLIIYKSLESHDSNKGLWFEYNLKQLRRFGNFGKDVDIVRKYLKVLGDKGICSYRKKTLLGSDYRPKTFYFARINDDKITEVFKDSQSLKRETILEPRRKMKYLPDYFKEVNGAASEHFIHQPIPEGYIPHPDNPFLYLGEEGILIHPEMANYDSVLGTLDLTENFESAYYRRKFRHIGQENILHCSELIKYLPLQNFNSLKQVANR